MIKIRYRTVDGVDRLRRFKTLNGATKYAHDCMGKHPDKGSGYVVSTDGIATMQVWGDATMDDIWPENDVCAKASERVIETAVDQDMWNVPDDCPF